MKRSPIRRGRPRRRTSAEREQSRLWKAFTGVRCMVCPIEGGVCDGPIQGHHVVSKAKLKKLGRLDLLWDRRNKLDVCEGRHRRHTDGVQAIPLELVPAAAAVFAEELGLDWWLERFYG